nr:polysaccharide biosynthesis tyrosine autokinase [Clostridia bacterium]
MDELQKQPEGMQADQQMVATVTAAVLQILQATGTIPNGEQKNPAQPEVKTIDLIGLFFAILEKFWLVLVCAIVGASMMGWLAGNSTTTYTATSKLYIVDTSSGSLNIANLQLGTVLTLDYQEVFKTWEVHEMVIEDLQLPYTYEQMQSLITISNPEDTRILYITVRYPDAKMAADIANAYAKAAKTFIINTMRGEEPSDFSIALEPSVGYRVSKSSRMVMGFMLGSVLAVGLITLLFVLDNRPRSPEQIQQYGGIPTLAVFPDRPRSKAIAYKKTGEAAPVADVPRLEIGQFPENDFVSHEAMNTLCTNLSYCGSDVRKVMITSRYAGEGKSYVSMNLMRSLSRLGRRVVLVDTDLRASGIQSDYQLLYNTQKRYGLSDYLSGQCSVNEVLYQTNISGAYMIPAGHEAPNPLQLLDTEAMKTLVEWLGTQFDVVLIDTPPVGVLVDAVAMAKFCDGALMVVGYRKGNQSEIGDAVKNIKQTGCKMLGAVLNGVKFKSLSNKHYYYSSERYSGHYSKRYKYGRKAK